MVLPACFLLYLLSAPIVLQKRLFYLFLATFILLAVSFSWALFVDFTPTDQRPFVGGTQNNSVLELITAYNGLERIFGNTSSMPENQLSNEQQRVKTQLIAQQVAEGIGIPEIFRFYNKYLTGQINWLLPLSLICLVVLCSTWLFRFPFEPQQKNLIFWALWLVPQLAFYSFANEFHPHYLTLLAPGIAALNGIGLVNLWAYYRGKSWLGWILPFSLITTAFLQVPILNNYPNWSRWLIPVILVCTLLSAFCLILLRFQSWDRSKLRLDTKILVVALFGFVAVLIGPTFWSTTPVFGNVNPIVPFAGPNLLSNYNSSKKQLAEVNDLATYLVICQVSLVRNTVCPKQPFLPLSSPLGASRSEESGVPIYGSRWTISETPTSPYSTLPLPRISFSAYAKGYEISPQGRNDKGLGFLHSGNLSNCKDLLDRVLSE